MPRITWEKTGTVAIVTMNEGENRFNPSFLENFLATFDEIEGSSDCSALLLLSSDPKNWSLGIDLQWITEAINAGAHQNIKKFLYDLNKLFRRILLYPMPVIAGINGHAFGAGAIMACACDFRFMKADRGFFCFPEIDIRIPFLPGMLAIVGRAVPAHKLQELVLTGKRATAGELAADHVVVRACTDDDALRTEALGFAGTFAKGRTIFAEMKKRMHCDLLKVIEEQDPPCIESLQLIY